MHRHSGHNVQSLTVVCCGRMTKSGLFLEWEVCKTVAHSGFKCYPVLTIRSTADKVRLMCTGQKKYLQEGINEHMILPTAA